MYKRLLCLLLVLCMVISIMPLTAEAATNSEIRSKMIQILYNGAGGRMSCDFDGYVNTSGRHEGIDFCASGGKGTSIYSLVSGVVTRVSNSSSLSTLAIYDETNNMTVVYLHGYYSLAEGDQVNQGQYIGYETNLGASAVHTHVEVRSGKRTHAAVSVGDATLDNSNPYPYWEKVLFGGLSPDTPETTRTVNTNYSSILPIHTYAISTGEIAVYNAEGTAYSNRHITGSTDLCIIREVYTDGWCYISYPSSVESDGYFEAYVPLSTFISSPPSAPAGWSSTGNYIAYARSNLAEKLGSVSAGDNCKVAATSGNLKQVIYPVTSSGYWKMGWINVGSTPVISDSDFPTPILGYNYSADTRTTVYESVGTMGTYYGQIFVDDLCTINSVNINGNWAYVNYPASGGTKNGYVYLNQFFPSLGNIGKPYTTTVSARSTAYRKADMATSYGYAEAGDSITVVGRDGNKYQVIYLITVGANAGKYKLAWIYGDHIVKNLVNIAVTAKPSKTVYLEGESFSTSGMVVTAYYDDGSSAAVTGYTHSGYTNTPGSKTVTISYGGKSTAIDVTVKSKSPTALSITTKPADTSYFVGEDFNASGMVVKATYNNGTTANVTDYYVSYDFSSAGTKTVTVAYQYNGVTVKTTLSVTVVNPTISGIAVATKPSKTTYFVGDTLDVSGLTLTASYNDGSTKTVNTGFNCTPTALNTAGTQTITVSYGGKSTTFTVTVSEVALSGISVATKPSKTNYYVGDSLDISGLTLKATYSNGSVKTITEGFNCTPTALNTAGTQTITVSYGGKSTTFTVTVSEVALSGISVATKPSKTNYYVGDSLDISGLTLKATYSNGSVKTITEGFTCTPTKLDTAGAQMITVSYGGKSATFTVAVEELPSGVISVSKVSGAPGEMVTVAIKLDNNPGIIAARLKVAYDSDVLTLMEVKDGGILGEYLFGGDLTADPYILTWENGLSESDYTATGTMAYLTFRVAEDATAGDLPITVTYEEDEIYNKDLVNVGFTVTQGTVTVEKKEELDPNAPQLVVESKSVSCGSTVTLDVVIANNPGFSVLNVAFIYDAEHLTLTKIENLLPTMTMTQGTTVVWDAAQDYTEDGTLCRLTFEVAENAPEGEYEIQLLFLSAADGDFNEITMTGVSGKLQVSDVLYGDVNGDGKIAAVDLAMLRKYIASIDPTTGESSIAVKAGADCNGDGKIAAVDLAMLRKYLASVDPITGESTIVMGPK